MVVHSFFSPQHDVVMGLYLWHHIIEIQEARKGCWGYCINSVAIRNFHTVLHSGSTNLYSHTAQESSLFLHTLFTLLFVDSLMVTILTSGGFPGGSDGKESACNPGDPGFDPWWGRYSGEGNGYLLQYSCLENSMDRGAWWTIVHGVTESNMTEQLTLSLRFWPVWGDTSL